MTEEIGLAQPVEYTEAERRTIATHEAGHATVAWLVGKGRKLEVLTIIKRKDALGLLSHSEEEERFTKTKSEVRALIDIAFGGMVAEELFFGESSTGVAGDLQAATLSACQMVGLMGMGIHPHLVGGHGVPGRWHRLQGPGQRRRAGRGRSATGLGQGLGDPDARRAPQRGRGAPRRAARSPGADRRRHPRGDQELQPAADRPDRDRPADRAATLLDTELTVDWARAARTPPMRNRLCGPAQPCSAQLLQRPRNTTSSESTVMP